ncbi:MAG TPA: methionyl-tRNA formyltransferase [Sphingobacteriaceae bacterium]|nr:methionyl-tRNA formyltransferase [Sphingobacteriaceae bacterium]
MRIIFMGTPEFAVASLDALVKAGFDVAAVVTAPDKPAGRGQKLNESAVKKYAVSKGLPVLQPEKLRDPDFLKELKSLKAEVHVVVAFRMLPEVVLNIPPKGTINLHASLLPQYRGAAPINWAIINGEEETGVTTFFIKKEIDTGNILFSENLAITENETAGGLHDKLMKTGAQLLVRTVKAVESGQYEEIPQDIIVIPATSDPELTTSNSKPLNAAPKIFKETCLIEWNQPVAAVHNKIRGLSPSPTAYTTFNDKTLKIFQAEKQDKEPGIQPGGFLSDGKTYLKFACQDGFICLHDLQLEGKKRMGVEEFLRGVRL